GWPVEEAGAMGVGAVGIKPATVRVWVFVMPTPPLKSSVKYVRPSSRTATPKAGGVVTLSINSPLGCVGGWQLGAAVAIDTPGVAGGNADWAVGGDLSDAQAESEAAAQHRNRPARVVRCMVGLAGGEGGRRAYW